MNDTPPSGASSAPQGAPPSGFWRVGLVTWKHSDSQRGASAALFLGSRWEIYLSRRITSPWPTSWSLSHNLYLNVAPLMPARGGPLSNRMPAGAWNTLDENGQRLASNSTRKLPASDSQAIWSPSSSTTTWGITPTSTGRSAIISLILLH